MPAAQVPEDTAHITPTPPVEPKRGPARCLFLELCVEPL
jgi:hypothetical protein